MRNKFVLSCGNEDGMVSVVDVDNFRTRVYFGFSPERVEFLGRVAPEVVERLVG